MLWKIIFINFENILNNAIAFKKFPNHIVEYRFVFLSLSYSTQIGAYDLLSMIVPQH